MDQLLEKKSDLVTREVICKSIQNRPVSSNIQKTKQKLNYLFSYGFFCLPNLVDVPLNNDDDNVDNVYDDNAGDLQDDDDGDNVYDDDDDNVYDNDDDNLLI